MQTKVRKSGHSKLIKCKHRKAVERYFEGDKLVIWCHSCDKDITESMRDCNCPCCDAHAKGGVSYVLST